MKLIKINGAVYTPESFNYFVAEKILEINEMDIYTPIYSASLGWVPSVDFDKYWDKKEAVLQLVKSLYRYNLIGLLLNANIKRIVSLILEVNALEEANSIKKKYLCK